MQDAAKHMAHLLGRIERRGCVLMLDFDGTLSPIVPHYRAASVSARTRDLLRNIARRFPVAVITGRALSYVRKHVSLRGVSFAGNHGFEFFIAGKSTRIPIPKTYVRARDVVKRRLLLLARTYRGVVVEDKKLTLFVHYSQVARADVPLVRQAVARAVRASGEKRFLRTIEAIEGVCILPAVDHNKGTAARYLFARLSRSSGAVPIFIGDDVTDEDAFRALKSGITIRVGKSARSAAAYYLSSRAGVDDFLRAVASVSRSTIAE